MKKNTLFGMEHTHYSSLEAAKEVIHLQQSLPMTSRIMSALLQTTKIQSSILPSLYSQKGMVYVTPPHSTISMDLSYFCN